MTTTFIAADITCGGCAASIQKALSRLPGIESVSVDVPAKAVTIQADEKTMSRERIAATLSEIGYPAS